MQLKHVTTLLLATVVLMTLLPDTAPGSVRIQIIDRGQADGILIRTPNDHWVVIDAGTNAQQANAMKNDWGVDNVELAIVSHRHFDHQGGMDNIIDVIDTERFIGIIEDCPTRTSDDKVRTSLTNKSVPIEPLADVPITFEIDGVSFTILPLPPKSDCPHHENNNSIIVRLEHGAFSMLFTGDAETDQLTWLVANHPNLLDVDVLKASHHGSDNGRTDDFLTAVSPERVVISAGVNATYKHPMPGAVSDYLATTGDRVYCTNRHGTIRVYGYLNGNIRIYKQRNNDKSCVYDGTHY